MVLEEDWKKPRFASQILAMQFSDSVDCGFRTSTEITKSYGFQPCCFFGRHHTYVTWIYLYIYIYMFFFLFMHVTSFPSLFQTFFWYQFSWGSKFSSIRNKHRWTAWNFLIEPDGDLPGAEMKKKTDRPDPWCFLNILLGGSKRSSKNP